MSNILFPLAPPTVPILQESARFPVGRIFCVGRNYAAHVREMGADPTAEPPIFFMKPANAALGAPTTVPFPNDTADLHHEVELVLAIHRGGAAIAEADALSHVYGLAVGVDLTKRDRQAEAKANGQPWERSKSFDASAPVSAITPLASINAPSHAAIRLAVNGVQKQSADIADMIWSPAAIVAKLSALWRLAPGDLIFTGTPEGVSAIPRGARIEASIDGVGALDFTMSEMQP